MDEAKSVDFEFLQRKIDDKSTVNIFLVNGVKLEGVIFAQDTKCIVMSGKKEKKEQLVYKKNISTVT